MILAQLIHTRYTQTAIHDNASWLEKKEFGIIFDAFEHTSQIYSLHDQNQRSIPPELSRAISALRSMSEDDLWKILRSFIFSSAGQDFIFVLDGVDDLLIEDQTRLLRNLRKIWESVQANTSISLKILIFSRPILRMQEVLRGLPYVDQDKEQKGDRLSNLIC